MYSTMSQPKPSPKERPSFFGPIVLIGLGVLFLLANLEIVDLSFWQLLFRFWPVFLIAAGLDILVGRRANMGPLVILMVMIGLIFGASWLGYIDTPAPFGVVQGETFTQALEGAARADVSVSSTISELRLRGGAAADVLLGGTVALHPNEELDRTFAVASGTAQFTLESGSRSVILPSFGRSNDGVWDLQLNRLVPINLHVATGIGSAILALQELNLSGLVVDAGVGRVEITLPAAGSFTATINGGVGGITVNVPESVAVRIEASTGLGSVNVDDDFVQEENIYQSPDYTTAANRINLTIAGGIGAVRIAQVGLE